MFDDDLFEGLWKGLLACASCGARHLKLERAAGGPFRMLCGCCRMRDALNAFRRSR
jgi:hypothetical protein